MLFLYFTLSFNSVKIMKIKNIEICLKLTKNCKLNNGRGRYNSLVVVVSKLISILIDYSPEKQKKLQQRSSVGFEASHIYNRNCEYQLFLN